MVGSFDLAKIKPLIATYLASLPTPDLPVTVKDVGVRPVTGVVKKDVFSGSEAKSLVSINFSGPAVYSTEESLRFQALLDVMNIRITDVLREKMALIYGGGMEGSLNRTPYEHYAIGVSVPTGPANVDKVIAATFAEIAQMKEQGPSAADLDKVKQNWIQVHRKSMRENNYWQGRTDVVGAVRNRSGPDPDLRTAGRRADRPGPEGRRQALLQPEQLRPGRPLPRKKISKNPLT